MFLCLPGAASRSGDLFCLQRAEDLAKRPGICLYGRFLFSFLFIFFKFCHSELATHHCEHMRVYFLLIIQGHWVYCFLSFSHEELHHLTPICLDVSLSCDFPYWCTFWGYQALQGHLVHSLSLPGSHLPVKLVLVYRVDLTTHHLDHDPQ